MSTNNMKTSPSSPAAGTTPHGRKQFLIALLILTAVSGYFLSIAVFVSGAYAAIPLNAPGETLTPLTETLNEKTTTLLKKTISEYSGTEMVFSFQGTLDGEQGMIAIINDKMVAQGASIDGVRVAEITEKTLTIEYDDKTNVIYFGESVTIIR